jgi:hypothetical protein
MHDNDPIPLQRCDRCNARSVSEWGKHTLRLTLCAHHHRHTGPALRRQGWTITASDLQARQTSPA